MDSRCVGSVNRAKHRRPSGGQTQQVVTDMNQDKKKQKVDAADAIVVVPHRVGDVAYAGTVVEELSEYADLRSKVLLEKGLTTRLEFPKLADLVSTYTGIARFIVFVSVRNRRQQTVQLLRLTGANRYEWASHDDIPLRALAAHVTSRSHTPPPPSPLPHPVSVMPGHLPAYQYALLGQPPSQQSSFGHFMPLSHAPSSMPMMYVPISVQLPQQTIATSVHADDKQQATAAAAASASPAGEQGEGVGEWYGRRLVVGSRRIVVRRRRSRSPVDRDSRRRPSRSRSPVPRSVSGRNNQQDAGVGRRNNNTTLPLRVKLRLPDGSTCTVECLPGAKLAVLHALAALRCPGIDGHRLFLTDDKDRAFQPPTATLSDVGIESGDVVHVRVAVLTLPAAASS